MGVLSARVLPSAYSTLDFTASTNIRDVSDYLDEWAHKDTPVLNRVAWGPESGGTIIEWLTEHQGFGYVRTSGAIASGTSAILITTSDTGLTTAEVAKQIQVGTVLYAKTAGSTEYAFLVVTTVNTGAGSLGISELATVSGGIAASAKLYIVGHFVNEGSEPFGDTSRKRALLSNKMAIHRKDIEITGSQMSTDMYAVANELAHQTRLRTQEMQFERERAMLLSYGQARSTGNAIGLFNGVFGYLIAYTAQAWVDNATTTLTEDTFNTVLAECWDNGGTPNVVIGDHNQIRKFTKWNKDRVRTEVDTHLGGHYVARYLTEVGEEVELLAMKKWPTHLLFILDLSKIKLRAKKGRKLIRQELGLAGDYRRWQIISEYSMEMRGYDWGYHGMFTALT